MAEVISQEYLSYKRCGMNPNTTLTGVNVNQPTNFNSQNSLPDLTNKTGGDLTSAIFGLQPALIQEISNMNRVYASKHGMFASIPIICRGPDCAYKDVCLVSAAQRTVGTRCPMEIAAILSRYEQWCAHFEIDTSQDTIDPKDLVDATLIKDLVNIEVQMMRAENKVALNGDFMADTLLDIDKKCNPYFGKIVSPEVEFLMGLQDKKIKILNQLNSTRKDKANDKNRTQASEMAIRIFQQAQELEKSRRIINVSDVQFDDVGEVIEIEPHEITEGGTIDGNDE